MPKSEINLRGLFNFQTNIFMQWRNTSCTLSFLQLRENENKSNVNKSLKDLFKVAMKNRVINVPMDEADKKDSVHLMELW